MIAFSSHQGLQDSKMRVLIVCTAILAYTNAAPSHFVSLAPLEVRTFAYPAAISPVPSGDIQAAVIDANVKYADLAQAAVDNARQISEQTVEDLNVKAYSNIAAEQGKFNEALWAAEDKKWKSLDAIQTAQAQLQGAFASSSPILAKGAIGGPYIASIAPYSKIASYPAVSAISSGDIQAAAIDANVKYADFAQAAVDKARQISESTQAQLSGALTTNAAAWAKGAAVGPYIAAVTPYPILPTVDSGEVQAALIDAKVKYADQTQAAIDNARLVSEAAQAQLNGAFVDNTATWVKSASVGPYVAAVAPFSVVPTVSSGDVQAALIDAKVKYADQAQAAIDNARQVSEAAQAQLNGAALGNSATWVKSSVPGPYIAAVTPYPILPTVNAGEVQAALIDAKVKYADQAQAAIDNARQVSEAAQTQLNSAVLGKGATWVKSSVAGPYIAAVAPYSIAPTVSSGDVQAALIDAQVKYADQAQAAIDQARLISEAAQAQLDSAAVAAYSGSAASTPEAYPGFVAPAVKSEAMSEALKTEAEKTESSEKTAAADVTSGEGSVKTAETNEKDIALQNSAIEKSETNAEAALVTAKSEADKALASLHASSIGASTVGLTKAFVAPNVYSSVAFGQPSLNSVQPALPLLPVVGPTYLKTLC